MATTHTALITGASLGIGEALARCFAADGHALVLVAGSVAKLEALAKELAATHGVKVVVLPDAAKRLAVDVLVNNAGVLAQGAFAEMAAQRHQDMIALNVAGPTAMLAHFVPTMGRRGFGRVPNFASIAAFQPVPTLATYAATKAYVLSLTESLRQQLKGSGVTVTALCPGITATSMPSTAAAANGQLGKLPGVLVGGGNEVAAAGYKACMYAAARAPSPHEDAVGADGVQVVAARIDLAHAALEVIDVGGFGQVLVVAILGRARRHLEQVLDRLEKGEHDGLWSGWSR